MARYGTEFIGTFFLVLTIGLTVLAGLAAAPLAIGSVLMVMVYMGAHVSGAHYNPAVTLAVWMRGAIERRDVIPYWLAQLAGALAASAIVLLVTASTFAPAPAAGASALHALILEFLFTFALALVILNVAVSPATRGNSFYGLAIGFTVAAGAFAAGPLSGGAFNPAVGAGPIVVNALAGGGSFADLWLYVVGPLAGGVGAVWVFGLQEGAGAPAAPAAPADG